MSRAVVFDFIARDRNYTGPMSRMERHTVRFGTTLGRFSGVAIRAFGGVGIAAVGLGVAGATMGVKTAAGLEQAQIAFTKLLGSGRKAQAFLDQLSKFAAATPFELPGLIDNARSLIGVGIAANKVIPIMTALGDTAGALGIDQEHFNNIMIATVQMFAKGKIQGDELLQMIENGIPVWNLLSQATGKSVPELQKLSKNGKLLASDVLPKLFEQMHKDYGGAMQQQSMTLNGLWSTFMDTLNIGLANAIKPLEPWLRKIIPAAAQALSGALKGLTDWIAGTLVPGITKFTDEYWPKFRDGFNTVKGSIKEFVDTHGPQFKAILDGVKKAFDTIVTALTDPDKGVVPNLQKLRQAWDDNKVAIEGFQNAVPGANKLLEFLGFLIRRALEEVTGLGKLLLNLASLASVGAQGVVVAFGAIGVAALKVQGFFQTLVLHFLESLRTLAGVVDRLLGTHLAGTLDGAIKQMRAARADTQSQVDKLKAEATTRFRELQREIDKLHGKKLTITGEDKVGPVARRIRQELADLTGVLPGQVLKTYIRGGTRRQAKGGYITGPGTSTSDSIPALLSAGEFVLNAKAVQQIGVPTLRRLNAMRFARGGYAQGLDDVVEALPALRTRMLALGRSQLGAIGVGGNVASWILQSLAISHKPASWFAGMMQLVKRESGGNPRAWNPITVLGQHASGIGQMLMSTFLANALDGLRNIWNPVHNLVSSERYIGRRYGSPYNIPHLFGKGYVGYRHGGLVMDAGGWLAPGWNPPMYNGTGRPERVGGGDIHVHLHGPVYGDKQALVREIRSGIRAAQRRENIPASQQIR